MTGLELADEIDAEVEAEDEDVVVLIEVVVGGVEISER